ncbi:MAG: phage tail protein [Dehalococcoidales bacterium]|nr:phage tail protein [Dehalococcoidales bacterium]
MPNRRKFDHIANCKFRVEIEGVTVGAFMEVDGLESITEVEEFADGDDIILRKRPGRTSYSNIILKRGFTWPGSELWDWREKVVEGKIERKAGSIIICGDDGSEIMRYNFFEAWPCRWRNSMLHGMGNSTMTEEVELVVEKIEMG